MRKFSSSNTNNNNNNKSELISNGNFTSHCHSHSGCKQYHQDEYMTQQQHQQQQQHTLNNDLSKFKSSLIKKGALANRQQPQQIITQQKIYLTNTANSQDDETDTATTATTTTTNGDGDDYGCQEDYVMMDDMEGGGDSYVRHQTSHHMQSLGGGSGNIEFTINMHNHKLNGVDLTHQQQHQNKPMNDYYNTPGYLITKKTTINAPTGHHQSIMIQQSPVKPFVASFSQPLEQWSCESVAQWLSINDLSNYVDSFLDKDVDGEELVQLDSSKLKAS